MIDIQKLPRWLGRDEDRPAIASLSQRLSARAISDHIESQIQYDRMELLAQIKTRAFPIDGKTL
jgi:hypothetical protein